MKKSMLILFTVMALISMVTSIIMFSNNKVDMATYFLVFYVLMRIEIIIIDRHENRT